MNTEYDIKKSFQRIEETLIKSMKRNLTRHLNEENDLDMNWSAWQAEQIKSLEQFKKNNKELFKNDFFSINNEVEELIKKSYENGKLEQEKVILQSIKYGSFNSNNKKINKLWNIYNKTKNQRIKKKQLTRIYKEVNQTEANFFKINDRKLKSLINETTENFQKAELSILRYTKDKYRQIIYDAQVYANTGSGTVKQAVDMATKDFLSKGINNIEYANGAMVNIASYAEMAIRTANKRAYLQGEGTKRQEWGVHTVLVPNRGGGCPYCIKFQGKVFTDDVWSGGTEAESKATGYPLLSGAIKEKLFHPNCKDTIVTYFPDVNKKPIPPTKEELEKKKENYIIEQKQRYNERQIRKYKRLELGSTDSSNIEKYHDKRLQWQKYNKEFCEKHNLKRQYDREDIKGIINIEKGSKYDIINLLDEEKYAVNQYISSESYILNEALRDNMKLTDEQEIMKSNLDKALNKCPKYEGIVTRSLELDDVSLGEFLNIHKEGQEIQYDAYTSTTLGQRYNDNSNVEIFINSKNGRDIRHFNQEEQEILFKRETKFKVTKNIKENDIYYIYLEEL